MDIKNNLRKHLPVIIVFLFLFFLFFSPSIPHLKGFYNWIISQDKYYSVIVGISIVILGCFYYFHRITVDANMKKIDFLRINLKLLLDALNDFDLSVDEILNKQAENDKDLNILRLKLRNRLFSVLDMIKHNNNILEFTEHEKETILRVTSFVDNSDIIMTVKNNILKKEQVSSLLVMYKDKIDSAKKMCFYKMAKDT